MKNKEQAIEVKEKKEKVNFFELSEEEQKLRKKKFWKKFWKIGKKVLFAVFCVALILLMTFALLGGNNFFDKKSDTSETSEAILLLRNYLLLK